jgi:uncharacterized protein involved in outer membrane biogenesis
LNSTLKLAMEGSYNNEPFNMEGTSGTLAASMDSGVPWPLKLSGMFAGARMVLDGSIKDVQAGKGIDLKFNMATDEIERLVAVGRTESPVKGKVSVQGRLTDPGERTLRLDDLKLGIAESDLNGWLYLAHGKKVKLQAELNSNSLDLRPFLVQKPEQSKTGSNTGYTSQIQLASSQGSQPAKDDPKKVFSAKHLPFELLREVEAEVKLDVSHLITPRLSAKDLKVTANVKDGVLEVSPLTATVGGGQLKGNLRLAEMKKAGVLKLGLDLENCNLETILAEMGQQDETLEGKLELEIALETRGKSVAQLMSGLNGKTVITMKNGKIHNEYVNLAGADLQRLLLDKLNPLNETNDYTELICLVQGFNIKKGLAKVSALYVETDHMLLEGAGEVDLGKETLDIGFEPGAKEGTGIGSANLSISFSELIKPFMLTGTLAEPAVGLDVAKAITTIGKTAAGYGLFGVAGLATAVLTRGEDPKDACKNAEHLARFGKLPPKSGSGSAEGSQEATQGEAESEESSDPVKSLQKGLGGALKGLFGQ